MKKIIALFILIAMTFILSSCQKENKVESALVYSLNENKSTPQFDAQNAYAMVDKQVSFGPRDPGSEGHKKGKEFLESELRKYADEVELQNFTYTGYENEKLELTNIIAKFNPKSEKRIFICAHWDCRPRSDQDKIEKNKLLPIPGANDGASGCGIILELARILKQNKIDYGIDLVLVDGEDYGKESDLTNYCLGAKYFAANVPSTYKPVFGVLLDLVGDKEAVFEKEGNSVQTAPDVVNMIWGIADKMKATTFSGAAGHSIYDDHIPLNQAGLFTIDIIDADLVGANTSVERRKYWHTQKDDMSNIGKETLQQVGAVLTKMIYSLTIN
jgi:glutaminyl-peptide cyclotransferase